MVKTMALILLLTLLVLSASCAADPATDEPTPTSTGVTPSTPAESTPLPPVGTVDFSQLTPPPPASPEPEEMPMPGIPDPAPYMENLAKQDLATRLSMDISQIRMVEQQAVDWNDSSLGCPQPGFGYLTVITPGYRIVLEAGGDQFVYHTDLRGQVVLCDNGRPVP